MENNPFLNSVHRSWATMPPITKSMVVVVLTVHILSILIPAISTLGKSWGSIYNVCFYGNLATTITPSKTVVVVSGGNGGVGHFIWTFIVSTWAHTGLLHLLMNTLVLVTSGSSVEHTFGSPGAYLIFTILLQILVNSGIAIVYTFQLFTPACVLGLSGVLFGYIAFECNLVHRRAIAISEAPPSMLFCGMIPMRTLAMPWFLLLIGIVLIPGSSTLGHFIGLVCGMALAWCPPAFDALLTLGKHLDNIILHKIIELCTKTKICSRICSGGSDDDGTGSTTSSSSSMCSNGTITPGGSRSTRAPYASKYSFGMLGKMKGAGPGDLVAAEEGAAGGDAVVESAPSSTPAVPKYVPFSGQGRKLGGN